MKINLENMKELAERLDHSGVTLDGMEVDDVCSMAYQLQYFFEGIGKISGQIGASVDYAHDADDYIKGFYEGTNSALEILNGVLVDKPEEK